MCPDCTRPSCFSCFRTEATQQTPPVAPMPRTQECEAMTAGAEFVKTKMDTPSWWPKTCKCVAASGMKHLCLGITLYHLNCPTHEAPLGTWQQIYEVARPTLKAAPTDSRPESPSTPQASALKCSLIYTPPNKIFELFPSLKKMFLTFLFGSHIYAKCSFSDAISHFVTG